MEAAVRRVSSTSPRLRDRYLSWHIAVGRQNALEVALYERRHVNIGSAWLGPSGRARNSGCAHDSLLRLRVSRDVHCTLEASRSQLYATRAILGSPSMIGRHASKALETVQR